MTGKTWGTLAAAAALAGCMAGGRIVQEKEFRPCTKGANCPQCQGRGDYRCPACFGRGFRPCTDCRQTGMVSCKVCGGDGLFLGQACGNCGGTGQLSCKRCAGNNGMMPCPDCEGKGMVRCGTYTTRFRCRDCGATFEYRPRKCPRCAGGT